MKSVKIILTVFFIQSSWLVSAQHKIGQSIQELKTGTENTNSKNTTPPISTQKKESRSSYPTTTERSSIYADESSVLIQENLSESTEDEPSGNFISNLLGTIISYVTYYTFIGSYELEDHLHYDLTKYPYFDYESGNYIDYCPLPDSENNASSIAKFRLDLENKYLLSSKNSYGNHLKIKLRPIKYAYLQVDYFELIERNSLNNYSSNLSLFNFNACYDRVRFENFNLGFTLGANYVANDIKKAGFTYGLNLEAFLLNPVSLNSSFKWSRINDIPVNEFEIEAKCFIKNVFVSVGYEWLKIGSPSYNYFTAGLGVHFYK